MSYFEWIEKRKSIRQYLDQPIEASVMAGLKQVTEQEWNGPLGTIPFFRMIELETFSEQVRGGLGSYGLIRGAQTYIAGAVEDSDEGMVDYGYCLEKIIIEATRLGLGTCWLGGSFKKTVINKIFTDKYQMKPLEIVPAITPVGYGAEKKALRDRVIQGIMKTHLRKPWSELFFMAGGERILSEAEAGPYKQALEAVRLAPSAVNYQPWRIWKEPGKNQFHFLTTNTQLLDIGIAMAHFELVAAEAGQLGEWVVDPPKEQPRHLRYIVTWKASDGIIQQFE